MRCLKKKRTRSSSTTARISGNRRSSPAELMHCVVQSVEDVIADGVIKTALSFIAPEHGEIEDALARAGIKVFRRVLYTGPHTTALAW